MHESERLLFAVAADAEQLAGGMPGQLQRKNQKTENWTERHQLAVAIHVTSFDQLKCLISVLVVY